MMLSPNRCFSCRSIRQMLNGKDFSVMAKSPAVHRDQLRHLSRTNSSFNSAHLDWSRKSDRLCLPKITATEYSARREKLVDLVKKDPDCAGRSIVLFIPSNITHYMAKDVPYVFRQNSDFRYLCGYLEPDSLLILQSSVDGKQSATLLRPKMSADDELWHGSQISENEILQSSAVDEIVDTGNMGEFLSDLSKKLHGSSCSIFCEPFSSQHASFSAHQHDSQPAVFKPLTDFLLESRQRFRPLGNPRKLVHECRVVKSSAEADLIRHAADITCNAFHSIISRTSPGMNERQISAMLEFESVYNGADRLAFPPVCASGNRANTIHYIKNDEVVRAGELILVDAGCEVEGYCSDVCRAFPVDREFTNPQRVLYEIVLDVQQIIIKKLMDIGNSYELYPSLDSLYTDMLKLIGQQAVQHGIVKAAKPFSQIGKELCPHHISHYLGMDVHDVHTISRSRKLEEGMVFTVEPGIYIDSRNESVATEFRGIGIRIEDDLFLSPKGPEVLTKDCPSSIKDIERLKSSSR